MNKRKSPGYPAIDTTATVTASTTQSALGSVPSPNKKRQDSKPDQEETIDYKNEERASHLVRLFIELDTFLFAQTSKRTGASLSAIREIMHLETSELAALSVISPDSFTIEWRAIENGSNKGRSKRYELYISMTSPSTGRAMISSRKDMFRKAMDSALLDTVSVSSKLYVPDPWAILPAKPHTNGNSTNNSNSCGVSRAEKQRREIVAASAASIMSTDRSSVSASTELEYSLESLRTAAKLHKEKAEKALVQRVKDDKEAQESTRRKSLPQLCHVLRLIALSTNRSTTTISSLMTHLRAKGHEATPSLKVELEFLATIVPEFVTIFPPDDVINESTIRINLATPFTNMIAKLGKELTDIEGDRVTGRSVTS